MSLAWELVVRVDVAGRPIPKARPRVVDGGRRTYTPAATLVAERALAWHLRQALIGRAVDDAGAYAVAAAFGGARASADVDNLLKSVLDAGNGVVWLDDRQVVAVEACRTYAGGTRTEVQIWRAERFLGQTLPWRA